MHTVQIPAFTCQTTINTITYSFRIWECKWRRWESGSAMVPTRPTPAPHTLTVTECSLSVEAHYCTEGHFSNICNPRGLNVAERKHHHLIHQTNGGSASKPHHSLILLPVLSFHSITHKHTSPHHWELWSQVAVTRRVKLKSCQLFISDHQ